jgi:hypothetical protein
MPAVNSHYPNVSWAKPAAQEGAGSMKTMLPFLFVETQLHSRRKHIDWMIVLAWATMATALCILLAVR